MYFVYVPEKLRYTVKSGCVIVSSIESGRSFFSLLAAPRIVVKALLAMIMIFCVRRSIWRLIELAKVAPILTLHSIKSLQNRIFSLHISQQNFEGKKTLPKNYYDSLIQKSFDGHSSPCIAHLMITI